MKVVSRFEMGHEDIIHDICYDFYGKRLATCSSDQRIKVWDQNEKGEWVCSSDWKAHSGSVWKVHWAHPEYGQVIASCSFDRTVCIWEEEEEKGVKRWAKRATLVDSRDSVSDVKFAPRHLGLKLATCSSDGYVRVYEAADVTNLSHWSLMDEFDSFTTTTTQKGKEKETPSTSATSASNQGGLSCITWNPSNVETKTMIAVGSNEKDVKIWEYNDNNRKWVHLDNLVIPAAVHDIAWAPNIGRSYHLIATASKDRKVRIWKVTLSSISSNTQSSNSITQSNTQIDKNSQTKFECKEIASFDDHHAEVWRVEWNITGTVLASSGDDGTVRLYKPNMQFEWKCVSVISGEDDSL